MTACTISNNVSAGPGGGVWNRRLASLKIENSTVSGNRVYAGNGGGICNWGSLTMVNTTLSGNRAQSLENGESGGQGGALFNLKTMKIDNCTIVANQSLKEGGGLYNLGTATVRSTILAGNASDNGIGSDCSGALISSGYNLIQNTNDFTLTGDLTTNILGQDPLLGPLQDNGGPTLTHALLPGSPAIDQGSSGCQSRNCT